jgi:L,D-peptidoglycan transpeptidase YkuD (ErfK/YbiS/YcfS/YnhG family)
MIKNNPKIITVLANTLYFNGKSYSCAVGKKGFSADKKEGDSCSPLGIFALRECWYRADKMPILNTAPTTQLPLKIITQNDGWCDDIGSVDYNKHVKLLPVMPSACSCNDDETTFSHEKLWREDDVYDLIIPISYNDAPVIAGVGSAIFLHIAKENYTGTEGCIALAKHDLLKILPLLSPQTCIEIRRY